MRITSAFLLWVTLAAGALAQQPVPAPAPPSPDAVTFNRDVAPIFNEHCVACHRPGQMAPMSLLTHESARPWARSIQRHVTARTMPPWGADPGIGSWDNDPSLSAEEIATISRWVDAGAPKGSTPPPEPPVFSDEWRIGTPDLVVSMAKPFPIPAAGVIEYQYFEIPTNLTEDRWVQAMEIRPGDARAVHHLRVFARGGKGDTRAGPRPGEPLCIDEVCGNLEPPLIGFGPNIASIAVGTQPESYRPGSAKLLKAGSVLTLHVHYTAFGEASSDQTRIGFVFSKEPPAVELKTVSLAQEAIAIPPGAAAHAVEGELQFKEDVLLHSLGPHAHLRGRSWEFALVSPDGTRRRILSVPRFDFNWQLNYAFETPLAVPAGSRLVGTAVYDNSKANPDNPDPTKTVHWGNLTTDEMMFASVVYSRAPKARPNGRP